MGKKSKAERDAKLAKKMANLKSREDRANEIYPVIKKFSDLGLSSEFESINLFNKMMLDYVDNGTTYFGQMNLEGVDRNVVYRMNNNKKHETVIYLQNMDKSTKYG